MAGSVTGGSLGAARRAPTAAGSLARRPRSARRAPRRPPTRSRPPASTTGSVRRSARGTLRSVNRSCSVLVPPRPTGRMRSPSRQPRTVSGPSPDRLGRDRPPRRPARLRPPPASRRSARCRARRAARARGVGPSALTAAKAQRAVLRHRDQPAAEVQRPRAAALAERQHGVHLGPGQRRAGSPAASSARPPQHDPRQAARQLGQRRDLHRGPAAEPGQRVRGRRVEHLGLVAQRERRLGDGALGARVERAQRGQRARGGRERERSASRRSRRPRATRASARGSSRAPPRA